MNAVLISIGNELLNGKTVNTNATYITRRLFENGISTSEILTVGDNPDIIRENLERALKKANLVILTGGLGPTHDDITKKVVADFFHSELVFNETVLKKIEARFRSRGTQMPLVNRNQALVPDKARLLENPVGTAPGMLFEENGRYTFVLPGVPREMKAMMEEFVIPFLKENFPGESIEVKLYRTTGIAESRIYEICREIFEGFPEYEIAFLPEFIGVDIRVILKGKAVADASKFKSFEEALFKKIGKFIFTSDHRELEEVIAELLRTRHLTLAVAESCSGGLLQDRITNISGSSEYFLGGLVTYSNESKVTSLGVKPASLERYGAVSEVVAREMAAGARRVFGADIALSTTGIAGPTGTTPEKPVGLVFIGLATADEVVARKFLFVKERRLNKELTGQAAMEMLRRHLLDISIEAR